MIEPLRPVMRYACLLSAVLTASAQDFPPDRPIVEPPLHVGANGLAPYLPVMTNHWVENWADIHIIQWCKEKTKAHGYNPQDMYSFNVHYDDCDPPWIFCLHKDYASIKEEIIANWGRIPMGMRESVRHIGVWPTVSPGAAYMQDANLHFNGAIVRELQAFIHETAHAVDYYAFPGEGLISSGRVWRYNTLYDTHFVTPYSRNGWREQFAEAMWPAIWDIVAPGGLAAKFPAQLPLVKNQIATMRGLLEAKITPRNPSRPKCTTRFDNSPAVLKSDSFRYVANGAGMRLPDTSMARYPNITILPPPPAGEGPIGDDFGFNSSANS